MKDECVRGGLRKNIDGLTSNKIDKKSTSVWLISISKMLLSIQIE